MTDFAPADELLQGSGDELMGPPKVRNSMRTPSPSARRGISRQRMQEQQRRRFTQTSDDESRSPIPTTMIPTAKDANAGKDNTAAPAIHHPRTASRRRDELVQQRKQAKQKAAAAKAVEKEPQPQYKVAANFSKGSSMHRLHTAAKLKAASAAARNAVTPQPERPQRAASPRRSVSARGTRSTASPEPTVSNTASGGNVGSGLSKLQQRALLRHKKLPASAADPSLLNNANNSNSTKATTNIVANATKKLVTTKPTKIRALSGKTTPTPTVASPPRPASKSPVQVSSPTSQRLARRNLNFRSSSTTPEPAATATAETTSPKKRALSPRKKAAAFGAARRSTTPTAVAAAKQKSTTTVAAAKQNSTTSPITTPITSSSRKAKTVRAKKRAANALAAISTEEPTTTPTPTVTSPSLGGPLQQKVMGDVHQQKAAMELSRRAAQAKQKREAEKAAQAEAEAATPEKEQKLDSSPSPAPLPEDPPEPQKMETAASCGSLSPPPPPPQRVLQEEEECSEEGPVDLVQETSADRMVMKPKSPLAIHTKSNNAEELLQEQEQPIVSPQQKAAQQKIRQGASKLQAMASSRRRANRATTPDVSEDGSSLDPELAALHSYESSSRATPVSVSSSLQSSLQENHSPPPPPPEGSSWRQSPRNSSSSKPQSEWNDHSDSDMAKGYFDGTHQHQHLTPPQHPVVVGHVRTDPPPQGLGSIRADPQGFSASGHFPDPRLHIADRSLFDTDSWSVSTASHMPSIKGGGFVEASSSSCTGSEGDAPVSKQQQQPIYEEKKEDDEAHILSESEPGMSEILGSLDNVVKVMSKEEKVEMTDLNDSQYSAVLDEAIGYVSSEDDEHIEHRAKESPKFQPGFILDPPPPPPGTKKKRKKRKSKRKSKSASSRLPTHLEEEDVRETPTRSVRSSTPVEGSEVAPDVMAEAPPVPQDVDVANEDDAKDSSPTEPMLDEALDATDLADFESPTVDRKLLVQPDGNDDDDDDENDEHLLVADDGDDSLPAPSPDIRTKTSVDESKEGSVEACASAEFLKGVGYSEEDEAPQDEMVDLEDAVSTRPEAAVPPPVVEEEREVPTDSNDMRLLSWRTSSTSMGNDFPNPTIASSGALADALSDDRSEEEDDTFEMERVFSLSSMQPLVKPSQEEDDGDDNDDDLSGSNNSGLKPLSTAASDVSIKNPIVAAKIDAAMSTAALKFEQQRQVSSPLAAAASPVAALPPALVNGSDSSLSPCSNLGVEVSMTGSTFGEAPSGSPVVSSASTNESVNKQLSTASSATTEEPESTNLEASAVSVSALQLALGPSISSSSAATSAPGEASVGSALLLSSSSTPSLSPCSNLGVEVSMTGSTCGEAPGVSPAVSAATTRTSEDQKQPSAAAEEQQQANEESENTGSDQNPESGETTASESAPQTTAPSTETPAAATPLEAKQVGSLLSPSGSDSSESGGPPELDEPLSFVTKSVTDGEADESQPEMAAISNLKSDSTKQGSPTSAIGDTSKQEPMLVIDSSGDSSTLVTKERDILAEQSHVIDATGRPLAMSPVDIPSPTYDTAKSKESDITEAVVDDLYLLSWLQAEQILETCVDEEELAQKTAADVMRSLFSRYDHFENMFRYVAGKFSHVEGIPSVDGFLMASASFTAYSRIRASNCVRFMEVISLATGVPSPFLGQNPFLVDKSCPSPDRSQEELKHSPTHKRPESIQGTVFGHQSSDPVTVVRFVYLACRTLRVEDSPKPRAATPEPDVTETEHSPPSSVSDGTDEEQDAENTETEKKVEDKPESKEDPVPPVAETPPPLPQRYQPPSDGSCPFNAALEQFPVTIKAVLEFAGDPVVVCRMKMLNKACRSYVDSNEHVLMRDAVRLGGMHKSVRPYFWLWVTLQKGSAHPVPPSDGSAQLNELSVLEKIGAEGKWKSVIDRDVSRSFGNLPPHKTGARLRTDSIVRALAMWGKSRIMKRGVRGSGEAPPLSLLDEDDESLAPTDTVSEWGGVSPVGSFAGSVCSGADNDETRDRARVETDLSADEDLALGGNSLSEEDKVHLREKLRFVLHSLAAAHSDVGYCQGMDYVVAHLLRILQDTIRWQALSGGLPDVVKSAPPAEPSRDTTDSELYANVDKTLVVEETCFRVMDTFFTSYNLRHFYWPELRCLKTCCLVFERLIQIKLPVLADHFEHHELNVGLFALGWFQTLFLYLPSMPSATVCHMWDIWLVERSFKIFFRVGTAILFLSQPTLLNQELEGMMGYLNTFPDATLLSPDILIACALQIKVTNRMLTEIEEEVTKAI